MDFPFARKDVNPEDILSDIRDTEATEILTEEYVQNAVERYRRIQEVRAKLGLPPYDHNEATIFLNEGIWTAVRWRGRLRMSGKPYFSHLEGAVDNLINDVHITGPATLSAAYHHDDEEDIPACRDGKEPILCIKRYKEKLRDPLQPELNDIEEKVRTWVHGVTKIQLKSREETNAMTFRRLLEVTRDHGLRAAYIKVGDRTHNMSDLNTHDNPTRRREIAQETAGVVVPFSRSICRTRVTTQRLIEYCLVELNPALLRDFEKESEERLSETLGPHRDVILDRFQPDGKSRALRRFLERTVLEADIVPTHIAEFVTGERNLEDLRLRDLKIPPRHPLFQTVVTVKKPEGVREIARHIEQSFASSSNSVSEVHYTHDQKPPRRGSIVMIHNRDFGGMMEFRVNDQISEARSRRGILGDFIGDRDPDLERTIASVLRRSERRPGTVFRHAFELLGPRIVVRTPNNEPVELPKGASVLDFAGHVHTDLLVGAQSAEVSQHIFSLRSVRRSSLDEVRNEEVIAVDTCIQKDKKVSPEGIKADPGWLLFCVTDHARDNLKAKFLRNPENYVSIPEGVETEDWKRKFIEDMGQRYVARLATLFGITSEEIIKTMRDAMPKRLGKSTDGTVLFQIGRGSNDPFRMLAAKEEDGYERNKTIYIEAQLPDRPGIFRRFIGEFARENINLNHIMHIKAPEKGQPERVVLELNDLTEEKSAYDILKVLLKLSYRYKVYLIRI